jgi:hypothetical protein
MSGVSLFMNGNFSKPAITTSAITNEQVMNNTYTPTTSTPTLKDKIFGTAKNLGNRIYIKHSALLMKDPEALLELAYFSDPTSFKQAFLNQGISIDDTKGYDDLKEQFEFLAFLYKSGQDITGKVKLATGKPNYFSVAGILNSLSLNHSAIANSPVVILNQ